MNLEIIVGDSKLILTQDGWQSSDEALLKKARQVVYNPFELTYIPSPLMHYAMQVSRAVKGTIVNSDPDFNPKSVY